MVIVSCSPGREYFPELGLYDYRNRFYYPTIGRFLESDPMGFDAGDMNLFRYCDGDPVNGSDPFGLHDLGDDAEIAAWNGATTKGVVVNGYDLTRSSSGNSLRCSSVKRLQQQFFASK